MSGDKLRRPTAPANSPRARWLALLLGLMLIALSLLAARDLYVRYANPTGWDLWLGRAVAAFRDPEPVWVGVGGAIAVLLGLALLFAALLPRRKPYRAIVATGSPVWVRRVDLARFTTATAKRFPGVISASSLARKKNVIVTAEVVRADDSLRDGLRRELSDAVAPIFGEDLKVRVVLHDSTDHDAIAGPTTSSPAAAERRLVDISGDPGKEGDVQ